jgi:hypothetical protein
MRTGGLLGTCRLLAWWRVLAVAVVVGMAPVFGVSSGIASAAVVPHRDLRLGAHAAAGSGLALAQAPAGLRAAVRRSLGVPAAAAARAFQQTELTDPNGAAGDAFGTSVAISGATAVVGAPHKNSDAGAVYVFVRSAGTWSLQAELTAADGAAIDCFGWSVAVSGSTVVVGAIGNNSGAGAAYVFVRSRNTWSQQPK